MKHETPIDLWLYEKEAFADGFQLVCGVDEAGRGPLAGPVCAAAVILPPELVIPGLNDSKKLTDKKRRELCSVITAEAVSYGIAFASEQEIDEIHILQADCVADAEWVRDEIRKAYPQVGEITITALGVVIGAHCGPGLLTVFYLCNGRRP